MNDVIYSLAMTTGDTSLIKVHVGSIFGSKRIN